MYLWSKIDAYRKETARDKTLRFDNERVWSTLPNFWLKYSNEFPFLESLKDNILLSKVTLTKYWSGISKVGRDFYLFHGFIFRINIYRTFIYFTW